MERPLLISRWVSDLGQTLTEMLSVVRPDSARLRHVARGILVELETAPFDRVWQNWEALKDEVQRVSANEPRRSCLLHGLRLAQLVAWLLPACPALRRRSEPLMLAALLHECGRIVPAAHWRMEYDQRRADAGHTAWGAALAAGLQHISIEVPMLIAQHHECCDGTGTPAGLVARQLSRESRWFLAVGRLYQLMIASVAPQPDGARHLIVSRALDQMQREAAIGELDASAVVSLCEALAAAGISGEVGRPPLPAGYRQDAGETPAPVGARESKSAGRSRTGTQRHRLSGPAGRDRH